MAVRILLIGARLCRNFGGPSLLMATTRAIGASVADAQYTFLSPTVEDVAYASYYGVSVLAVRSWKDVLMAALARAVCRIPVGPPDVLEIVEAFSRAAVVIDIWGIAFADTVGRETFRTRARRAIPFLVGRLLRKRVVKYTADMGPFEGRWNKFFAKLSLRHGVDLILARDEVTRERVMALGVATPVRVCPDTAFLLDIQATPFAEQLRTQKRAGPVVGISLSHMAARQSGDPEAYVAAMTRLADHVAESVAGTVVLIANEVSARAERDDMWYVRETWRRMARRDCAVIAPGDYTAPQMKGIIGECDAMVAARYHSIVASLSQGIPTLAIGWHDKYHGILALVGQERYVCQVALLRDDHLRSRFDELWASRDHIRAHIIRALPGIRQAVFEGAEQVALLCRQGRD